MTEAIESSTTSNEMYCFEINFQVRSSQSLCFNVGGLMVNKKMEIQLKNQNVNVLLLFTIIWYRTVEKVAESS